MRILHVVESLNPATGGPAVSVPSLAAAQAAFGHDVTLLCYAGSCHGQHLARLESFVPEFKQLRIYALDMGSIRERVLGGMARAEVGKLTAANDLIHIHGIWRPISLVAAKASLGVGKPPVISPRGMLDPWSLRQKSWKKRLAMSVVWKDVLNRTAFLHALNAIEARLLQPLRLQCRVEIFPNGVFPAQFNNVDGGSRLRDRCTRLQGRPYILFLGRLHYKKGLDVLVDAFERLRKLHEATDLVIAGPDEGYLDPLMRRIRDAGLTKHVHIVGPLYGADKLSALSGAACFCLPSRQEGFSNAILESLACGVPVVITRQCNFPEVAETGAGIVVGPTIDELATGLLKYVGSQDERHRAGTIGYRFVRQQYDWRVIAAQMLQAYSSTLSKRAISACWT